MLTLKFSLPEKSHRFTVASAINAIPTSRKYRNDTPDDTSHVRRHPHDNFIAMGKHCLVLKDETKNFVYLLVYYFYLPDLDEETVVTSTVLEEVAAFAPYAEYQMSMMPLLTLMLIVLLPCFNLHIKRSFVRISHLSACFPERPTSIDAVTVDEARDLYFEKLKGQWQESATNRG
ncbi:hypothetical protein Aduo_019681 [Ancylostoma duodenale]